MTFRTRARLLYALLFVPTFIGLYRLREGSTSALAISLCIGGVASMYIVPSFLIACPHCGRRQIGWDLWGYFFVGNRCRGCHQLLDGPKLSDTDNMLAIIAEDDPKEASELGALLKRQEQLKINARMSPAAAAEWRDDLLRRKADAEQYISDVQAGRASSGTNSMLWRHAQETLASIEQELAQLEASNRTAS